jgi:hypothetical protein
MDVLDFRMEDCLTDASMTSAVIVDCLSRVEKISSVHEQVFARLYLIEITRGCMLYVQVVVLSEFSIMSTEHQEKKKKFTSQSNLRENKCDQEFVQ